MPPAAPRSPPPDIPDSPSVDPRLRQRPPSPAPPVSNRLAPTRRALPRQKDAGLLRRTRLTLSFLELVCALAAADQVDELVGVEGAGRVAALEDGGGQPALGPTSADGFSRAFVRAADRSDPSGFSPAAGGSSSGAGTRSCFPVERGRGAAERCARRPPPPRGASRSSARCMVTRAW